MKRTEKELNDLFEKYSADTCSRKEFDRFLDLVDKGKNEEQLHRLLKMQWDAGERKPVRRLFYRWSAAAAAVAILVLLSATVFLVRENRLVTPVALSTLSQPEERDSLAGVTRVKLPDGSIVMLREGSRLDMLDSFAATAREVKMEGEAYFDIAPDPSKPFIIHTGKIKTTVLGTAFSIKAFPNESLITVTVTRGIVKVEDDKHLLAVLEADRQLVYDTKSNRTSEKVVDAGREVAWKSHDMVYRDASFGAIVEELSRIYEVNIVFESEDLKRRLITASLDDRDPIEKILDMLCISQRAYYISEGGLYIIKPLKR